MTIYDYIWDKSVEGVKMKIRNPAVSDRLLKQAGTDCVAGRAGWGRPDQGG